MNKLVLLLIFYSYSIVAIAQERIEMEGTSITGNRELPKVLTIVPWKPAEPVTPGDTALNSILDQPPKALNRSEFKRRINYHQVLFTAQKEKADP